jgi:hypothetical protein
MLLNLNKIDIKVNVLQGSIIILGAGVSGIFLAYLLRNSGKKIIVIEKGNFPHLNPTNLKFEKKFEGEVFNKSFCAINKFFGGWSNYWGGLLVELKKNDIKKKYWGFSHDELVKFYNEIYKFFNIKIDKNFLNKEQINKSFKSFNLEKYLSFYLKQPNFVYYFEKFIKQSNNVYFYYNCTIKNVITDSNKIKNIELTNIHNKSFLVSGDTFILSMGTYGNNQFLLSLKQNKPNFLRQHKNIGRYMHDHIGIEVGKIKIKNKNKFRKYFENGFHNGFKYQPKILSKYKNLSISGQFEDKSNYNKHILQVKKLLKFFLYKGSKNFKKKYFSFKTFFLVTRFLLHWIVNKRILNFTSQNIRFFVQAEQTVMYSNCIKIAKNENSNNNFLKKLSFNWKFKDNDFKDIIKFTEFVNLFLKENGLGNINMYNLSHHFFKKNIQSTYHLSGGTIISKDIKNGVCDRSFKVWGVDNLYVSGASLFPCSGSANITLTILALTFTLSKKIESLHEKIN